MSDTPRLPSSERSKYRHNQGPWGSRRTEPALGSLDERLSIIIRRLGGRSNGSAPAISKRLSSLYPEWFTLPSSEPRS